MIRSTRRIKIGGLAARGSRLFGSSTDDEEVKKLRLLFVTRSMMPIQAPDIGDLEDKLAKGRVTPGLFSESVKQLMVSGRYRLALDIYEKMVSEDEENSHFSSASVLNDATLLMLVHCYSSIGKMGPFVQLCASLRDKRKYSPLFIERMIICFADLDRLDVVEALLMEWLGRNLNVNPSGGDASTKTTDWNEVLGKTLQEEQSVGEGGKDCGNAKVGSSKEELLEFMLPLQERTSPKMGKRSKRSFLSSTKSAQFTENLLANLDVGTLSYSLPSIDVWRSVSRMYADRTAWVQCLQISALCFSHRLRSEAGQEDSLDDRLLVGIVHHTVRALCRSGQYLKALDYLQGSEQKLGRKLRKASTLALFLPYFHTQGSPAALQVVLDSVLDLMEAFLANKGHRGHADDGTEAVEEGELRGLIAELVSLLCRRGYAAEASVVVDKLVESLSSSHTSDGGENNGSDGGDDQAAAALVTAKILRPSVLSNLVNALAMRGDDRAIALFHTLKFKEGPLARAMSADGYTDAVDSAYHSLMSQEKFLAHVSTLSEAEGEQR